MKVLFLVQSCNQERFLEEEEIIRKTWGSRLRKGCDLIFYRGDGTDTLEGDVLKLKSDDDLKHTFTKTIRALSVFRNSNKYDFIVRTNTSTWINVELLLNTLDRLDPDVRELYGGYLVSNAESQGAPFLRGNFIVINKQIMKDIFEFIKDKCYTGVDDVCLGMNLLKYYNQNNIDYLKTLKIMDNISYNDEFDLKNIFKYVGVWCASYIKEKNSSSVLNKIDKYYINKTSCQVKKVDKIETIFGDLKF